MSRCQKRGTIVDFTAALLKVASRCNINCDYCYVYKHADQSWRDQPVFMSDKTINRFGERLNEYVESISLEEFSIIFHGGEPLLYTPQRLVHAASEIRNLVHPSCSLNFSLQTNGILLTDEGLAELEQAKIAISLSLDGPRKANDLHRLNHTGHSTYEEIMAALQKLLRSDIFQGVIAVIDTSISARELYEFFYPMKLPRLDFLLPDATHACPPPNQINDPNIYRKWLENAYEVWFHEYPDLPIRWFDAVLASRLGIPSPTDVMGFGAVSLIVIETNGSYTDHDVFKITRPNGASLQRNLYTTTFKEIACHPSIREHGYRLTFSGLAKECRACPVVEACGGGCVMHRYHPIRGLEAPTVYCREMFGLLTTATGLLRQSLKSLQNNVILVVPIGQTLVEESRRWRASTEIKANAISSKNRITRKGLSAASIMLRASSPQLKDADYELSHISANYKWLNTIQIQSSDPWLIRPFSDTIRPLPMGSDELEYGVSTLTTVASYLAVFDPLLPTAIADLISDIIFVESTLEEEGGIFSFSDDTAPNVLYIASYVDRKPIEADDLADSILHEFLHQILYHMERDGAMLFDHAFPRFPAPWRSGLRPSGGFFHGTFVFAELSLYWKRMAESDLPGVDHRKARHNAEKYRQQATYGIQSLKQFALVTPRGMQLMDELVSLLEIQVQALVPPGVLP